MQRAMNVVTSAILPDAAPVGLMPTNSGVSPWMPGAFGGLKEMPEDSMPMCLVELTIILHEC